MFRIGEFSKLARVSIRTLRHYDEIGLLVPDQVGPENGYRYYSAQQMSQIARIQLLREMGIGLQTIGQMLQQLQNPHELERFLVLQQLQLKDQQQELQHRIGLVQSAIDRLRKEQNMSLFHVEKKTFPAMQVAALRRVIPCYEQEGELWKEMRQALRQLGAEGQMSEKKGLMTVYYDEGFCEREVDVEIRSVISGSFSDCQNVQFKTIPSITAATAMLNGRHDQVGQVYAEIARWVEQNVNHPSIVTWDQENEGNVKLEELKAALRRYDPTRLPGHGPQPRPLGHRGLCAAGRINGKEGKRCRSILKRNRCTGPAGSRRLCRCRPAAIWLSVGRAIPTSRREAISRQSSSFTPWPTR